MLHAEHKLGSPRALIFDLMGTCLDWHSSITPVLNKALHQTAHDKGLPAPNDDEASTLALEWRTGFFKEIHSRFETGQPQEDIDDTHRRVLLRLFHEQKWQNYSTMSTNDVETCVRAWHTQTPWADLHTALPILRRDFDVVVLANGTTRLQIDITKSSGLSFDMLLSSELLGLTKPDPRIYLRAMELLGRRAEECVMVAAHAYDLRAARGLGMKTAYLRRWTEDLDEDMAVVERENDLFLDARECGEGSGGLMRLVELLCEK